MRKEDTFILSIDEGTSSAKAFIFDSNACIRGMGQESFHQYYPHPGWVEHDPEEIWQAEQKAILSACNSAGITTRELCCIGVTNQRETCVLWEKDTGKPLYPAITWQDRRTANLIEQLDQETKKYIQQTTGLIPDAYFSGPKIKWILDTFPDLRRKTMHGTVLFGTMDTYLIYKLTEGQLHITDVTNAARTMLFNIHTCSWDSDLLTLFNIPENVLPEVKTCTEVYGTTKHSLFQKEVMISGCIGDQQAALYGQGCFHPGMVKNTYGTGNFILMNTGTQIIKSKNLLTTIACSKDQKITYALEGSIFVSGALIEWLINLGLITDMQSLATQAKKTTSNDGVYLVPAFVGLGAPYWNPYARGTILGITRGTTKEILIRAALESIVYSCEDVFVEMKKDSQININEIRVDGGGASNDFLLQLQADISQVSLLRPQSIESTARGAAFLAGLAVEYYDHETHLSELIQNDATFSPMITKEQKTLLYNGWKNAIDETIHWAAKTKEIMKSTKED